jgi:asparagine synthase (glutamine-hydrolysing)
MQPFFQARLISGRVVTDGDPRAELGSRPGQKGSIFAAWNWDGEKLTVTNDRYGFYPIYYAVHKDRIAISPSITQLVHLNSRLDFDEDAFAVFLRLGWLIGNDTLFKSVKALPPDSVLTWHHGNLEIRSSEITGSKPLNISRSEAIRTYAELFQTSMATVLSNSGKFAVPISGGRDSRHILLASCKAQRKPDLCLTVPHPPPYPREDVLVAKQLCQALGVEHKIVEQTRSLLQAELRKNELTDYSVYEHGWFLALSEFIEGRWDTVTDGIGGDVLSAGVFLSENRLEWFRSGRFEELAEDVLGPEGYLPALLSRDTYEKYSREKAVRHLSKELSRYADEPNPIGSFYFWNRTRRCIALNPFRLLENTRVITPYLDPELFDFLSSLPAGLLLDQQFHTDTIAFAYPEYSHIPYEDKTSAPIIDVSSFRRFSRDILAYSLSKRHRILTDRRFFLVRCSRCIVDSRYSRAVTEFGDQAILLMQLERL